MLNRILPQSLKAPIPEAQPEASPFTVEFYMVQGVGFHCMAYQDKRGKWRSAFNHDELYGEILVME